MSVISNYIEGYARGREKAHRYFLEISYGSLKESRYLLDFAFVEKWITYADYQRVSVLADEIGAMVWGILSKMKTN